MKFSKVKALATTGATTIYLGLMNAQVVLAADGGEVKSKLTQAGKTIQTVRMWMSLDPSRTQNPQGKRLVAEYERQRDCPASYASGKDTFARKPDQVILASVEVNGKKGTFIVDTGASVVAITRAFAERAGIDYLGGRRIAVQTANGNTDVHTGMAKRIQIRQVAASQVPVTFAPEPSRLHTI